MPRGVYPRRPRGQRRTPAEKPPDVEKIVTEKVTEAFQTMFDRQDDQPKERRYLSGDPIPAGAPAINLAEVQTAPEVSSPVSAPSSCGKVERLWRKKIPVWQCDICRLDTTDPTKNACPRGLSK